MAPEQVRDHFIERVSEVLRQTKATCRDLGIENHGHHSNDPALQPQTFRYTASEAAKKAQPLVYGRMVGGSNAHFTANFWRMRPSDFNEASRLGSVPGAALADWPITYEELEPYYTKAEYELGISGLGGANPFEAPRSKPYPLD